MDNLTHSLIGVLFARIGMPRELPRRCWVGAVAANAPDFDLLASTSPAAYLIAHRHLTHAVLAIPVMAACAAALVWAGDLLWYRARGRSAAPMAFGRAWLFALLPAASHPLLDWTNSYAIRPWLPFDGSWSSGHLMFVIDVWIWAGLAAAVFLPLLLRWGRIGRERAAMAALAALAGYAGWQQEVTRDSVAAIQRRAPADVQRVAAFPVPFDPRLRSEYVELPDARVVSGTRFLDPLRRDLVDAAWATELGQAYRQFSLYPLEIVEPRGDGWRVELNDARFLRGGEPALGCVFELDAQGRVIDSRFAF